MSQPESIFALAFREAFTSHGFKKERVNIDMLSVCTVMLDMYFGETLLAKGTGWFWRQSDGVALVTAWHNFSGLHHTMRTPISAHGGMPDRAHIRYMAAKPKFFFKDTMMPLYFEDEPCNPRWFVHPELGNYLDMAFVMLTFDDMDVHCINDAVPVATAPSNPGDEIFAIGFPQGVSVSAFLPIWKRGTIASDPDVPIEGLPRYYVDLAGRGGLSGAPVYRREPILHVNDTDQSLGIINSREFLGLYSGRTADQLPPAARTGESTDLGFIWRAEFLLEMLAARVQDERPEVGKGKNVIKAFWGKLEKPESL